MKNKLSHKRIIAILFALALTLQMAAPGFVWDKSFAEDGSEQQTLLGVEPKEDKSGEQKASDSKATDSSVKDPEEQPDMPPWIDVVVIDGINIKAKAEKGALPKTAKLKVTKTSDSDASNIMTSLEGIRGGEREQVATHIYNVAITDSDSKELTPADNKRVKVTFESEDFSGDGFNMQTYFVSKDAIEKVSPDKVDIDKAAIIIIDVTKPVVVSEEKSNEKTESTDTEKTEDDKDVEPTEVEGDASDNNEEKVPEKEKAPKLRATPDTGLFVGTNMAMVLIIAVAVIAGGLIAVLSFRRREL